MNKSYRIPIITKKSQSDRMLKEIEWRRACGMYRAYIRVQRWLLLSRTADALMQRSSLIVLADDNAPHDICIVGC